MGLWGTYAGNIIMTVIVSMVPVIELRGAIPMAAANGLDGTSAFIAAFIGNLIPVPFIIIFIRKIFDWMRIKNERLNKLVKRFEEKAARQSDVIDKYEWFGLVILVAIPLPGTGAWTGALVAAMLDMRLKRAFPAIALGVLIAGIIVAFITNGTVALISN